MINLSKILRFVHISKFSFYFLLILIVLSFSITFYLLLPNNELVKDPQKLQFLLLADVIFVLILLSIIIRQVLLVLIYRKKNFNESKLYIKFVNLFTAMALGPAIGVVIITSLFFNLELRTWHGGAVREAVVNSNIVARDYENEIQAEIISDTQLILREIVKVSRNNEVQINSIERALNEFINLRTISNIYIFNRRGEVFLSLNDKEIKNFNSPKNNVYNILDQNQVYIFQQNDNSISAYKKVNFLKDIYIQVNRDLKITVKFLSNEIRADGLDVSIHQRICSSTNSSACSIKKIKSNLEGEIKLAILKKAAIYKKKFFKKKREQSQKDEPKKYRYLEDK